MKTPTLATTLVIVASLVLAAVPAHAADASASTPTSTSTNRAVGEVTTSLTLRTKTKKHRVTARVKLIADDGTTYPIVEQQVVLQKKVDTKWKTFKKLTTSGAGTSKVTFSVAKKTLVRARYAGSGEVVVGGSIQPTPPATSKTVRVG